MDKLKGICILVLTFFSFGLTVFFMPFQVYEVFSALDSEVLEAEIIDSEFDRYSVSDQFRPSFPGGATP